MQKKLNADIYTGVLLENNSRYDKDAIKKAVGEFQKRLNENDIYGVMSEDISGTEGLNLQTPLSEITHKIKRVNFDEETGNITGEIELIDTMKGKLVKTLLKEQTDSSLRTVPRIVGYNGDKTKEVTDIITFDIELT